MKNILFVLILLLISCDNERDEIQKVEEMLGTKIPDNYEIVSDYNFGVSWSLETINIQLKREDFEAVLRNIDTTKFKKVQGFYHRGIDENGTRKSLILFTDDNSIKYTEKD